MVKNTNKHIFTHSFYVSEIQEWLGWAVLEQGPLWNCIKGVDQDFNYLKSSKMAHSYGWRVGTSCGQETSSQHVSLLHIDFNQGWLRYPHDIVAVSPRTNDSRGSTNRSYLFCDLVSKVTHHHFATLYLLEASHKFWAPLKERGIGYHLFKRKSSQKICGHIF